MMRMKITKTRNYNMKIVFMGTPDFASATLRAILEAGFEVTAVVTQPDKPKGRGKELQMPPVKECALEYGIPVFQPVKIKRPDAIEELKKYEADIYVVAAFGQILSQEILDLPRYGCICVHASLLPKYRGAAPIQWSIMGGEKETGVTIMQMDAGIDTGDILTQVVVPITAQETGDSLFEKLSAAGSGLLLDTLPKIERGEITPVKQQEELSNYAKMLNKKMGLVDWSRSAVEIERWIRGLNSWPGAYTFYHGKQLKLWEAAVQVKSTEQWGPAADSRPGMICGVTKDELEVCTGEGVLILKSIQLEGKKRMNVHDFLLGYHLTPGEMLGEDSLS